MHKPSSTKDYFFAALIALGFTLLLGIYLYFRRGYLFDAPVTAGWLYVPNKVIGGVSLLMLSLTFLTGPVIRYFDKFDHMLKYRKEIGVVGGLLAIAHAIISIWLVPAKFDLWSIFSPDRYLVAFSGLTGVLLLSILLVASWKSIIQKIGGVRWWFLQRWGIRLVVLATALHLLPMKWSGWVTWFNAGTKQTPELLNPWMTPASLLVALFLAWVVIVRLYESLFLFHSFGIKTKEISMDPQLKLRGRRFFQISFCLLLLTYAFVLGRGVVISS